MWFWYEKNHTITYSGLLQIKKIATLNHLKVKAWWWSWWKILLTAKTVQSCTIIKTEESDKKNSNKIHIKSSTNYQLIWVRKDTQVFLELWTRWKCILETKKTQLIKIASNEILQAKTKHGNRKEHLHINWRVTIQVIDTDVKGREFIF